MIIERSKAPNINLMHVECLKLGPPKLPGGCGIFIIHDLHAISPSCLLFL